jgi:DNA-binding protein
MVNKKMDSLEIKIGEKKSGSYIDFMKHNPADEFVVLARGAKTSKAIYIVAVMLEKGYDMGDVEVSSMDIGKKEPLAVLKICLNKCEN